MTDPQLPAVIRKPSRQRARIRSVRIHAGQGDILMAIHGLQALRELGVPFLAPDACVYTRTGTASLIQILLPDLEVRSLPDSKHAPHPRYVIVERTSVSTTLRNWLYPDYYVNFPERRLVRSFGYPEPGLGHRALMWLTDLRYGTPANRDHETPCYYAIKMWAPLAGRWGLSDTDIVRGLYRAYRVLRERLFDHGQRLAAARPDTTIPEVAVFPAGRGFQFVPPAFLGRMLAAAGLSDDRYTCYFGPKEPTIEVYRRAGLRCDVCADTDSALLAVSQARVTITSDSFGSHLAQLAAREHLALMSHDLPPHTIHPAAPSRIVFEPQDCCPCYYTIRDTATHCRAGRSECGVFAHERYFQSAVSMLTACRAVASGR